jgi:MFS family permease
MARGDSLAALRSGSLRRYAFARLAAVLGAQMQGVAVGWQLYERTESAYALGLVGLIEVIPVVLLALPVGHLVDRLSRRNVAIAAQAGLGLASLGLTAVSYFQGPIWAIFGLILAIGVATAFASPSNSAFIPEIVPAADLANANAWLSSGWELSTMGGPALAGILIAATGGATTVYALNLVASATYVAVMFTIPRPPKRPPPPAEKGALMAGLRFVWNTELFLSAITLDLFAVLLGGATALLPIFAKDILHVGPAGLGWLRAAPAVGAFLMAIVTTRLPPWKHSGRVLLMSVAGFGAATIGFGLSTSFPLSLFFLFLTGLFDNVSVVIRRTLEQIVTPDALRGRVSSVTYVFIGCSNELGAFESGFTAGLFGAPLSVLGGGIGTVLVVALVAWKWRSLARLGSLEELAAKHAEPHPVA